MDKGSRPAKSSQTKRWAVLLAALAGTIVAIFYPVDDGLVPAPPPPAMILTLKPLVSVKAGADTVFAEVPELEADPFAPRGWQAPLLPPPPAPSKPLAVVPAGPIEPPGPPPLPFRYVGRMNDSADQVVYLGHGEQALLARPGDVLENTYKVLTINASQIEFEHLPSGQKQLLAIPASEH
jgi:hypothetical protein